MFNNTSFPCKPKKSTFFSIHVHYITFIYKKKNNNIQIYKQSFSVVSELDQSELDSQFFSPLIEL